MSKPIWITIGSLETYEKTDSLKSLMKNFIDFCKKNKYIKGSIPNLEDFAEKYNVGPTQKKMLTGILELRRYLRGNKLIHNVDVIQDNFEFRSNRVAYLVKKHLEKAVG